MRKKQKSEMNVELRPEMTCARLLKGGVAGWSFAYRAGTNLDSVSAPDEAKAFGNNTEAINEALRFGPNDKAPVGRSGEVIPICGRRSCSVRATGPVAFLHLRSEF